MTVLRIIKMIKLDKGTKILKIIIKEERGNFRVEAYNFLIFKEEIHNSIANSGNLYTRVHKRQSKIKPTKRRRD